MANIGNILLEKEILLESGTNEVEILVFQVGCYALGINVAKVREVLPAPEVTRLPRVHPSMIGCFTLRDAVVPCVSLHRHLDQNVETSPEELTIILTEFNQFQTGFVVDAVERIHRVSWKNVLACPSVISASGTPVTAVTTIGDRLITMLDFEMIADQISQRESQIQTVSNPDDLPRNELNIIVADDSATVRQAITETLRRSGYTNVTPFSDGQDAWDWIEQQYELTGDACQVADLLISDVEMPRMDGFRLTKNVKDHPQLKAIPVVLFSSIMTQDNHSKGLFVKADSMITKPELGRVVGIADEVLASHSRNKTVAVPSPPDHLTTTASLPGAKAASHSSPTLAKSTNIWTTFQAELSDRIDQMADYCQQALGDEPLDNVLNGTLRTLHSIKSAAMAIEITEVAQVTHAAEGRLAGIRPGNRNDWPVEPLDNYVSWLQDLVDSLQDENSRSDVLKRAGSICTELAMTSAT